MTAPELMAYCRSQGIKLVAQGDRLRCYPRAAVTPELLALLRQHKAELLARLSTPPEPAPGRLTDPSPRDLAAAQAALLAFYPKTATPTTDRCRCGCMTWTDVAVHGGQSTRRDCAACGRFREFVQWHGQRFDN